MKKILNILFNIIKICCVLFLITFIAVVIVQRVSNNNFSVGGIRLFTVISESMVPEYKIGDVLIVKSVDVDSIKVGDDICYMGKEEDFKDKIVTHRVKRIENGTFITEGIANVMEDPPVKEDQIYGKVIYKTYIMSFMSKISSNPIVFFLVIIIPIIIFIVLEAKDFIIELFSNEEEEDDDEEEEEER